MQTALVFLSALAYLFGDHLASGIAFFLGIAPSLAWLHPKLAWMGC